jgi:ribosomal protein S18 acetylase RimI-like enzyme
MLKVTRVAGNLLDKCRQFLSQDPVYNVLSLGDCYSPLYEASTLYCAVKDRQVVGVCSVYHAFSTPSVALGKAATEIKRDLLEKALTEVSNEFTHLCQPDEVGILDEFATVLRVHFEQQMIADPPRQLKLNNIKVARVRKHELGNLDRFYREQRSEAWTPLQFKVGPFYCVKQDGKIVSAAGTHLSTPQIAHLGSIVTDEAYRNRGFAAACTNALCRDLASKDRIISLFVKSENAPAIRVYEKLGFVRKREIAFLTLRKKAELDCHPHSPPRQS